MTLPPDRCRNEYTDVNNVQSWSMYYMTHPADPTERLALNEAIAGASNARNGRRVVEQDTMPPDPAPGSTGGYPSSYDQMTLLFVCEDNSVVSLTVPAPLPGCFDTDTVTALPHSIYVAPIIAAAALVVVNGATGSAVASYKRGWRWRVSSPRA